MEVRVNGKPMEVPASTTVAGLVDRLGLRVRSVVVERNGEPVERSRYAEILLEDGDALEIVRAVQGGGP